MFELEGSGYYNRTGNAPMGPFTIWMANYTGGSLLELTTVPADGPATYFVNVTVPAANTSAPFRTGAYEFWSLENYTVAPVCANYPFNLTATPPTSLGCVSWSASLSVVSPLPASGAAGTPVMLQGRGFSDQGSTSIYWADPDGSSDVASGTGDAAVLTARST